MDTPKRGRVEEDGCRDREEEGPLGTSRSAWPRSCCVGPPLLPTPRGVLPCLPLPPPTTPLSSDSGTITQPSQYNVPRDTRPEGRRRQCQKRWARLGSPGGGVGDTSAVGHEGQLQQGHLWGTDKLRLAHTFTIPPTCRFRGLSSYVLIFVLARSFSVYRGALPWHGDQNQSPPLPVSSSVGRVQSMGSHRLAPNWESHSGPWDFRPYPGQTPWKSTGYF